MSASIALTGLGSDDVVPGTYIEVLFAQGAASGASLTYSAVILADMLSTGTGTAGTLYGPDTAVTCNSANDAATLFGRGSEAHRMALRFYTLNKDTPLYIVGIADPAGTAGVGAVTFTTQAAANGVARFFMGDEYVDATVASGDSVTTIAAAVKVAINAKLDWPVTANNSAGVLTITARQTGPRTNWLRYSCQMIGSGIATTSSQVATAFFTTGATADSNVTALATILPSRYYYIISAAEDATQFAALCTQVTSQATPTTGLRQRAFCGSVDTLANATTIATGINNARAEVVWMAQADMPPSELAAVAAASYAKGEGSTVPRCNWNGYGNGDGEVWPVKAPRSGAAPTRTQIKSALNNGLTPIKVERAGRTSLVKRVTSKSLNGSTADYRIRDAHKVTICDLYADDAQTKLASIISNKKIGNTPAANARRPGPTVITPVDILAAINKLTSDYGERDLVDQSRVSTIQTATQCVREVSPSTRISVRVPFEPIDIIDQADMLLEQVA